MIIIKPSFEILNNVDTLEIMRSIEAAGRTCYKSDSTITDETAEPFVRAIVKRGHESVLEHQSIMVRIVCDRGVSHEIVRHRLASYSQESTRYCNYGKMGEVTFIKPCFWEVSDPAYSIWYNAMSYAAQVYLLLLSNGCTPQEARAVLPNSLKTEIVVTMNLREWRHFFRLRALGVAGKPHPQMLEITVPMLAEFQRLLPAVFDDLR
jgi:thymidylate synthase (FAD)